MEGDFGSKANPVTAVSGKTGDNHQLTRSNSDASSLTSGICKDFFLRSDNAIPDECTKWTNEKHNLYLYHLEMSFVEQFYQSTSVITRCSRRNLRDIDISRKRLINVHDASEENGCWKKFNCAAGEPFYSSASADSHASPESKWMYQSTRRGMHFPQSPTKMPELLKLIGAQKQEKRILSRGIQTRPQEFSSSNRSNGASICLTGDKDLRLCTWTSVVDDGNTNKQKKKHMNFSLHVSKFRKGDPISQVLTLVSNNLDPHEQSLLTEGSGQNFLDEDNQSALKFESQAKRLKIALGDGSRQDQITPSRECPAPDHSVINNSKCGEQLAPCESV